MPCCILRVSGPDFDVDAFLEGSELDPYEVYYINDPTPHGKRVEDSSGFKVEVCDCDGVLAQQLDQAYKFLQRHQLEFARLRSWPTAYAALDFGYWQRNVAVQCDYLKPELLLLAGSLGIGIELSMYPLCDTEESSE